MYGSSYMFRHYVAILRERRDVLRAHHVSRHNTPIHNFLSNAPQLNVSQKALGTLLQDGILMPKFLVATIHN
jgi:hypothetical protein